MAQHKPILGFDSDFAQKTINQLLHKAEDGELFIENHKSEVMVLDDGRVKEASFDEGHGFGLRAITDDVSSFAHSNDLSNEGIQRSANIVNNMMKTHKGKNAIAPYKTNQKLYGDKDPLEGHDFADRLALLREIDDYARKSDPAIKQVTASLACSAQNICIMRLDNAPIYDSRPLVRFSVQIIAEKGARREMGMSGGGGRLSFSACFTPEFWKFHVKEAIRQALVNLDSQPAMAGEQDVVLGSGWPGILLHEAIGHGLEGDFHRKKTSAFSGLVGTQIAAKGVTVIDDGTIEGRRGSLSVDDEGTPTQRTVLIEDGIFKNMLQDRMNARLMGQNSTGNGRRESYHYEPMPRMTNTFMLGGSVAPQDIIASVKKGIYAPFFGGGQVDITSGKFVFSCIEAYRIENGKITHPLKGAMLIGHGPDALKKISLIGNDMQLDSGIGVCGKEGQGVPVGVGQPTLLIKDITVGGAEIS